MGHLTTVLPSRDLINLLYHNPLITLPQGKEGDTEIEFLLQPWIQKLEKLECFHFRKLKWLYYQHVWMEVNMLHVYENIILPADYLLCEWILKIINFVFCIFFVMYLQ